MLVLIHHSGWKTRSMRVVFSLSVDIFKRSAYSLEENCITATLSVIHDGGHLFCSCIGFNCV